MDAIKHEMLAAAPAIHDDDWIDRWAEVYLDAHINRVMRAHRVRFETFLLAPEVILATVQNPRAFPERVGLLPAQRAVQERLDREWAINDLTDRAFKALEEQGAFCSSNGRMTQKLRHKAHPRGAARFGHIKDMA